MAPIKGYMNGVTIYKTPDPYGTAHQCVDFARRYYHRRFNVTFPDVKNAYDLFDLNYAIDLRSKKKVRFHMIYNSPSEMPQPDDMIIWKPVGRYHTTGHVAIMKEIVNRSIVTVAEQNGSTQNGHRNIRIHHPGIIGWMRIDFP